MVTTTNTTSDVTGICVEQNLVIDIKFDGKLVDWINQQFPQRNWYAANGLVREKVGENMFDMEIFGDATQAIEMKQIPIILQDIPVKLFWRHTAQDLLHLVETICEEIMALSGAADLYLFKLKGVLIPDEDNEVKATWSMLGHIDCDADSAQGMFSAETDVADSNDDDLPF